MRRREGQSAEPGVDESDVTGSGVGGEEFPETVRVTGAARRKVEELGVDLTEVPGTGTGGQITVEDVKKRAKAGSP